jgi:hypothetical protein
MDMLLKVEMEKGRFYVSRHDAKLSSGAVHGGGSAGMVREEGSVHRHSQHLLLSLPACGSSSHARRLLSTGAPTSHACQHLPATLARGQSTFLSSITTPLRPADARAAGKGIPKRGRRLTTQARSTLVHLAQDFVAAQDTCVSSRQGSSQVERDLLCERAAPPLVQFTEQGEEAEVLLEGARLAGRVEDRVH